MPQLPWSLHHVGPVLVVSLFDGIGALFIALLALGLSFHAVAVESCPTAAGVCRASFRNVLHFDDVKDFTAEQIRPILSNNAFSAILVAGGSPCQDISVLHQQRRGLRSERTMLFQHVPRVARECEDLVRELNMRCPVLSLLENVSHGPSDVRQAMDAAMQGPPITIHACSFGWVRRTRCFWGSSGRRAMSECCLQPPTGASLDQDGAGCWHGTWSGKKPFPDCVVFRDRFKQAFDPRVNVGCTDDVKCFATFTQAIDHSVVPDVRASPDAVRRYMSDDRTFPAFAYEDHSLLWRGSQWRQPCASERAEIMSIPSSMLSWLDSAQEMSHQERERARASVVGNSFHVPSIMLALVLLFQMLPACTGIPPPRYSAFERCMRSQVQGSVFQPGMVESCPYLMHPEQLLVEVRSHFSPLGVILPDLVISDRVRKAVVKLQVYQADCYLRATPEDIGAPKWAQQRRVAEAASALGSQRGGPTSKFALPSLVPAGIGKETHMIMGSCLPSPFDTCAVLDPDAAFALRAMIALGPCIRTWRRIQVRALRAVSCFLGPWEAALRAAMPQPVARVASQKCPAMMTAMAVLLQWPDKSIGLRFVQGFSLLGCIESPGIFKPIDPPSLNPPCVKQAIEARAPAALVHLERRLPQALHAQQLFEHTMQEVDKGWAEGLFTKAQLDGAFGKKYVAADSGSCMCSPVASSGQSTMAGARVTTTLHGPPKPSLLIRLTSQLQRRGNL